MLDQMMTEYIKLCKEYERIESADRKFLQDESLLENITLKKDTLLKKVEAEGYPLGIFFACVDECL